MLLQILLRAVVVSITVLFGASALAQAPSANSNRAQGQAATSSAPAGTGKAYSDAMQNAIRLATGRDLDGALAALQEAVQQAPTRPEAYVLMAEVHRLRNDIPAARSAYERAARMAAQARAHRDHGEALAGLAQLLEAEPDRRDDARKAWTEYVSFADGHQADTFPDVGRGRIAAIDRMAELERVYVDVRKRIADREEEAKKPKRRPRGNQ